MKRIIIESPYFNKDNGVLQYNLAYVDECMKDAMLNHNEAPYASHALYTKFLDDNIPEEREFGIKAGFLWREAAEKSVVYTDLGISKGMEWGIQDSIEKNKPVEYRTLPPEHFKAFHEKNKHLLDAQEQSLQITQKLMDCFRNKELSQETATKISLKR